MLDREGLKQAVLDGSREEVSTLVAAALADGVPAADILNEGLLPGMDVVGKRFGAKEMFISEVLLSARAMHTGLALLKPTLAGGDGAGGPRPIVVLGTVRGDLHDIGKNLVAMLLEAGGFQVIDLGTNVSADKFLQAVKEHRPAVVALSALLTTTMREMRQTLELLRRSEAMAGVRTIIGGAPVTQDFADAIKADAYAPDAPAAVATIKALL